MTRTEKVLAWTAGVAAGALALFGIVHKASAATQSGGKTVSVTTANSGQTVALNVGDKLSITLPPSAATQAWKPVPGTNAGPGGTPLMQLVSDNLVPVTGSTSMAEQMVLQAAQKGTAILGLNLVDASNPTAPVATWQINVVVS